MTAKIFSKDLRLAAHPMMYVFALFGAMLIIPNYPYTVVVLYGRLGILLTLRNGRENKDVYYCAVLPVTKRDQVRARAWLVVAVELTELVLAVPFAFLSAHINPNGTILAGIDANAALFGSVLLIYGVFNVVFLPVFYKTAIRAGRAFLLAVIPMTVLMVLVEALSHFPVVGPYLDATDAAGQVRQLPVLAVGFLAQYLPWVLVPRSMYIYHYFASVPFIILATAWWLDRLPRSRPRLRMGVMALYLVGALVFFVMFFPYASGWLTSTGWLDAMKWFSKLYY